MRGHVSASELGASFFAKSKGMFIAATIAVMAISPATAQVNTTLPNIPSQFEDYVDDWQTGTWGVSQPGCFWAYFFCHENQEQYNAGVPPKFPPKLTPEAEAENAKIVAALSEGKSIFDPNSQCYPQGMPDNGHRTFEMVLHKDKIYMIIPGLSGHDYRKIWLDGREMPTKEPYLYTYNGDSIGHWEGGTLVIETRNITGPNTAVSPNMPKSDNFWVIERWTPQSADIIDVEITFMDEDKYTEPHSESFQFKRNPEGKVADQPLLCEKGGGQRYIADPVTGELLLSGPGGAPLEKAED